MFKRAERESTRIELLGAAKRKAKDSSNLKKMFKIIKTFKPHFILWV